MPSSESDICYVCLALVLVLSHKVECGGEASVTNHLYRVNTAPRLLDIRRNEYLLLYAWAIGSPQPLTSCPVIPQFSYGRKPSSRGP